MPDVTIVGGGPAGTYSARLLAASGRNVTVLEEHGCSGEPVHCAGVVSPDVIRNMGVRPEVFNAISVADVVLPDGTVISTSRKIQYAYVINRSQFDAKMADAAESAGAAIRYNTRYKSHSVSRESVTVRTNTGEVESDILVGADGQSSLVAASLGSNHARSYVRGIQCDLKYTSEETNKMILRLGNAVAPGFFAWQLPLGDITRFGLGINVEAGNPADYLNSLLKSLGLEDRQRLATYAGKIPLGGRRTSFADRTLLIGDAAGQVKPVSGGGLYPISKAAPILKEAVDRAYSMNMFNSSVMALYERSWKREIGKSLKDGLKLRNYYDRLSDDDLNRIGHLYARPDIQELLSDIDIDDPGKVVKPILRKKGVVPLLLKTYLRNAI